MSISAPGSRFPLASSAPDLTFCVEDAGVVEHAVVPTMRFGLGIEAPAGASIASIALRALVRIAVPRRPHDPATRERLGEVFGDASTWGKSIRTLPWADVNLNVPGFDGSTQVDLHVVCTYDFEVIATKYLHALRDGDVPVELLFSGSVFYREDGLLRVAQISWEKEACHAFPVGLWWELMDRYFPGASWMRLRRDVFDRLYDYRVRRALPTWEQTIEALLDGSGEPSS